MNLTPTVRFRRRHLPHWEVTGGRYFVTVRCADSLPRDAVEKIREFHLHLASIPPQSPQFAAFQRQIFHTLEKHLDAGAGSCPLREPEVARLIIEEFEAMADWQIGVPHFTVMPNHWHALFVPNEAGVHSLSAVMKRLKGRTAKRIRAALGGSGPVWQREWFDRWMRDEAEWARCVAYIQNNPVKAGLVRGWTEHAWTRQVGPVSDRPTPGQSKTGPTSNTPRATRRPSGATARCFAA